jgi:hypothetical protein
VLYQTYVSEVNLIALAGASFLEAFSFVPWGSEVAEVVAASLPAHLTCVAGLNRCACTHRGDRADNDMRRKEVANLDDTAIENKFVNARVYIQENNPVLLENSEATINNFAENPKSEDFHQSIEVVSARLVTHEWPVPPQHLQAEPTYAELSQLDNQLNPPLYTDSSASTRPLRTRSPT